MVGFIQAQRMNFDSFMDGCLWIRVERQSNMIEWNLRLLNVLEG